jgi:hypothetical protein
MRDKLKRVKDALSTGKDPEAFAQVDIIPGTGFVWDEKAKILRASIPADEIPEPEQSGQLADVGERIAKRAQKLLKK